MNAAPTGNTVSPPSKGKPRRGGMGRIVNILLLLAIIGVVALFVRAELERRAAATQLEQTRQQLEEAQKATRQGGEEVAQEVLRKLRTHIVVPEEPAPTVATIVDIERLREVNEFYSVAENGDHLIITERRAILYDPDRDIILDVVPVAINADATPGASPSISPTPAASSGPTPTPVGNLFDEEAPAATPTPSPGRSASPSPIS